VKSFNGTTGCALGAFWVAGELFGALGGMLGATEGCGRVMFLNGFTSFALSAMLLVRSELDVGGTTTCGGAIEDFCVVAVLLVAGLLNAKYQMPIAPRKKRNNAATPPMMSAIFAELGPAGFGIGGMVAVAVEGAGGGTLAVAVVGG
jgi:hypothetical protein